MRRSPWWRDGEVVIRTDTCTALVGLHLKESERNTKTENASERTHILLSLSPSALRNVFWLLVVASVGCLTFAVQNEEPAEFDCRRPFAHGAAEV